VSDLETMWVVVAGLLGLAVILFVGYLIVSTARHRPQGGRHRAPTRQRPHRDAFRTEEPEPEPLKRAAVIVHDPPSSLRRELTAQSVAAAWDEPLWLEVDDLDAAAAAARLALEAGVDVVCVRGDSTIDRGVAGVLAGTETPVTFLPGPVPVQPTDPTEPHGRSAPSTAAAAAAARPATGDQLREALTAALTGQNARVDIGRARLAGAPDPEPQDAERPRRERRLIRRRRTAAGEGAAAEPGSTDPVGTDAEPVGDAAVDAPRSLAGEEIVFLTSFVLGDVVPDDEPTLSTRAVARGLVKGTSFNATVKPDDEEAVTRPSRSLAFTTSPTAATSGALDAYLHASHSIKGWTGVARAMMRKSSRATPLLVPMCSPSFDVTLDRPVDVVVDGAVIGTCPSGHSTISVEPLALVVRR
jgi:diacylglycerol kinase (ATP)